MEGMVYHPTCENRLYAYIVTTMFLLFSLQLPRTVLLPQWTLVEDSSPFLDSEALISGDVLPPYKIDICAQLKDVIPFAYPSRENRFCTESRNTTLPVWHSRARPHSFVVIREETRTHR